LVKDGKDGRAGGGGVSDGLLLTQFWDFFSYEFRPPGLEVSTKARIRSQAVSVVQPFGSFSAFLLDCRVSILPLSNFLSHFDQNRAISGADRQNCAF
jgi:hypothetical protein